jgi:hypothetical protein
MPLGGQAGKVEDLLACPLGKVAKGPGEDGVDLAANPGKDREDGAVAEAKDEAEEIEEGDPEGEAGEWGPIQRTRLGFRDWRGSSCNTFGVGLGRFRSRFGWISGGFKVSKVSWTSSWPGFARYWAIVA